VQITTMFAERYHDAGRDYREPEKYEFCEHGATEMKPINRLSVVLMTTLLAIGCGKTSLTDRIIGKWTPQSVNGQSLPDGLRSQMQIEFLRDGTCRRGDESGSFKVVDVSTIQTQFGNQSEVVTVDIKGDILIMRMDAGVMQAKRTP
jgi:hypothetical protein